jgi:hypothetical protein
MTYDEHDEQVAVFRWAATKRWPSRDSATTLNDFMYAVPNAGTAGGKRAMLAGLRRKQEGVKSGIPDWESPLAVASFTGFHCEMKRSDGTPSDVSAAQRKQIAMLESCGRKCVVAFGADEAIAQFCEYLGIKRDAR